MNFIKRLFKNLWHYLLLPLGVLLLILVAIAALIGTILCIAILPFWLLDYFNLESNLLVSLSFFWFSIIFGVSFVLLNSLMEEEKIKLLELLLYGLLYGCIISVLFLCIAHPILILYIILTIIIIAVIVIVVTTIKEEKDG
mgnify:CR=1 FL=1